MITLEQLTAFKATYETGGYSSAARLLGKNRATVREHVVAIETSIDRSLFDVVGKHLEPTTIATLLYPRALRATKYATDFERVAFSDLDLDLSTFILLYDAMVPVEFLTALKTKITTQYPDLKLQLLHKTRDDSLNALQSGHAHLAILAPKGGKSPIEAVGVSYLGITYFSTYVHPDSPLLGKDDPNIEVMEQTVQYVPESVVAAGLNMLQIADFQHVVSSTELIINLLSDGGWTIMNNADAKKYVDAGWLQELPFSEVLRPFPYRLSLFEASQHQTNTTVMNVKTIIQECAKDWLS
jgi:DNA-binding transcriptional LysR family regulator